ncbi:hypothetical protein M9H77_06622 [Catharanthus roseus]|uniref:Uncharacterized protein n=1 Tax=Catharanthus roseus TaxID=4058 RepID=A0ACC0BSW2_CATRO|nr:hypothetical protein M9H77_06622 [Catharanthus roseus]
MKMLEGEKIMEKEVAVEVEEVEREKGRKWQVIQGFQKGSFRVAGRDISFDDRMLNIFLGIPENEHKMHRRSLKDNLRRSKRSLKITRLYEDEVNKLKTLKTRRIVRDSFIRYICKTP